jgi:hypothetical protein
LMIRRRIVIEENMDNNDHRKKRTQVIPMFAQ